VRHRTVAALALALLACAAPAAAQSMCPSGDAVEIVFPGPVGAAGTGLDAGDRAFFAAPGIEYQIVAVVRCGVFPYTYALGNAPSGMTVRNMGAGETCGVEEADRDHVACGLISGWTPASTSDDPTPTLTVTDANGHTDAVTWTIDTQTAKFRYLDAVNGNDAWDGTTPAFTSGTTGPRQSLLGLYNLSGSAGKCTYFATGTYTLAGITTTDPDLTGQCNGGGGTCLHSEMRTDWNEASRSVCWLGKPGATALIDLLYDHATPSAVTGFANPKPRMRWVGAAMALDNLSAEDAMSMGWQLNTRSSQHGARVSRMTLGEIGPGIDGGNSGWFMFSASFGTPSYGDSFVEVTWNGPHHTDAIPVKFYSVENGVVLQSTINDVQEEEGALAAKSAVQNYSFVAIAFDGAQTPVGGNMNNNGSGGETTNGLLAFSRIRNASTGASKGAITYGVAKINTIGASTVYRSTLVGVPRIENLVTADGPYTFNRSVIVNDQAASGSCPAQFVCSSVTDFTRLVETNGVKGLTSAGIVDANGYLTGQSRTDYGPDSVLPRGYEIGTTAAAVTPASPGRLRLVVSAEGAPPALARGLRRAFLAD
jgi:hypothetical protein